MKNTELMAALQAAVGREREALAEVLRYLREVERRRLFLDIGHSSLFVFCRKELAYSEQEAFLRIQAMRLMKTMPEAEERIEKGELSLSVAAKIQSASKFLPKEKAKELVQELAGASKRAAEAKIAILLPEQPRPEKSRPVSEDLVEIRFTVAKKEAELFQKLMDRKAHTNFERSHAKLFIDLAEAEMKRLEGKNAAPLLSPGKVTGRYIPAQTRRHIWKRDEGKCQFKVGERICSERHGLQIDHIRPYAEGGAHTAHNLRLLCGAHNRARNTS